MEGKGTTPGDTHHELEELATAAAEAEFHHHPTGNPLKASAIITLLSVHLSMGIYL